jgi:transposase InsO family protein
VRFRFIAAEKANFPVRRLCQVLQVSRAGFYVWQRRAPAARTRADQRLAVDIATIHAESGRRYGSPRIHAELLARGCRTSRKRVARLMRTQRLAGRRRRRFRGTTRSEHGWPIAPNHLARQFTRSAPDQAWATDITYIWTAEGWLYVAVIIDLCSRFIVGWAINARIRDALTRDALQMALQRRRPPRGVLHHSDRGSQYASGPYQRMLAAHGIVASMSRRGNCWDNAVAESFFATLKVELAHDAHWATRAQAQADLFEYIECFYNGRRRHSALGYLSPAAFERQWATARERREEAGSPEAPGSTIARGALPWYPQNGRDEISRGRDRLLEYRLCREAEARRRVSHRP